MCIAVTAASALGDDEALDRLREIVDDLVGVFIIDNGADGDLDFEIRSVMAAPVAAFAMTPALGAKDVIVSKLQQCIFVRICDEINVAAIAAISTTRAATRNELLATKGDAAVSAIAGFHCDFGFVDEHGYKTLRHKKAA